MSLTPIAHWDVVPRQRINSGESLKVGVCAFSKPGIDYVRFTISGQGYSGSSPIDVSTMSLNDESDTWEYWTEISCSSFSTDGAITVGATVYGDDAGSKALSSLTLYVNPGSTLQFHEAWIATDGNDTTGAVDDDTKPYATLEEAVADLKTETGGTLDGCVIYFRQGDHDWDISSGQSDLNSVNEWVTIKSDSATGANRSNTRIINRVDSSAQADYFKLEDIGLEADGTSNYYVVNSVVWAHNCDIVGAGRATASDNTHVFGTSNTEYYYTGCYLTDLRSPRTAGSVIPLMRGTTVYYISGDLHSMAAGGADVLLCNVTLDDQDPESSGEHSDIFQQFDGAGVDNVIYYNVKATDCHYQAVFSANNTGANNTNWAFINCCFSLNDPIRSGTNGHSFFQGNFNHVLHWHCTYLFDHTKVSGGGYVFEGDAGSGTRYERTNISCIGTYFWAWNTEIADWYEPENTDGNEFLHCHYAKSASDAIPDSPSGTTSPDTGSSTESLGDGGIDRTLGSAIYGQPQAGSVLINRAVPYTVPIDIDNNVRSGAPTVGAFEWQVTGVQPVPVAADYTVFLEY